MVAFAAVGGAITTSPAYTLQTIVFEKRFTGTYGAIDEPVGILGRDILNSFLILFDGPKLEWTLLEAPGTADLEK